MEIDNTISLHVIALNALNLVQSATETIEKISRNEEYAVWSPLNRAINSLKDAHQFIVVALKESEK